MTKHSSYSYIHLKITSAEFFSRKKHLSKQFMEDVNGTGVTQIKQKLWYYIFSTLIFNAAFKCDHHSTIFHSTLLTNSTPEAFVN